MEDYKVFNIVKKINLKGGMTEEEIVYYFTQLEKDRQNNVSLDESEARAILILAFDDFIWFIIKRKFIEMDQEEAYIEGLIGLVKAVDTYSLDKKIKFVTYAGVCIKNEILQKIRSNQNPKHKHSEISIYDESPILEEVPIIDTLADDEDFVKEVLNLETINQDFKVIENYFKHLNTTEQLTLIFSFGLYNAPILKQKEIADICRVKPHAVRRAYKTMMRKLYIFAKSKDELTYEECLEKQYYMIKEYKLVNLDKITNKFTNLERKV